MEEEEVDAESESTDESLSSSEEDSEAIPNADLLRGVCLETQRVVRGRSIS